METFDPLTWPTSPAFGGDNPLFDIDLAAIAACTQQPQLYSHTEQEQLQLLDAPTIQQIAPQPATPTHDYEIRHRQSTCHTSPIPSHSDHSCDLVSPHSLSSSSHSTPHLLPNSRDVFPPPIPPPVHVITIASLPAELKVLRGRNIGVDDPMLQNAFSDKVASKQVKRPRCATKLTVGDTAVPVSRRTKYVKLLETMNMELIAVRQQLAITQARLHNFDPHWDVTQHFQQSRLMSETATSSKKRKLTDEHNTMPTSSIPDTRLPSSSGCTRSNNALVTFDALLPQTRQFIITSMNQQSLYDATYVHAPLLFTKMDLSNRILDANLAFCETHGWSLPELVGRLLPPGNLSRMIQHSPQFQQWFKTLSSEQIKVEGLDEDPKNIAPLKKGLPTGISAVDLLPTVEQISGSSQLFKHEIEHATWMFRTINARGQLCEARVTSWMVYEDGPTYPSLHSPVVSTVLARTPEIVRTEADNAESARSVSSLYDMMSSFQSLRGSTQNNALVSCFAANFTPDLESALRHPTKEIGLALAQTFGTRRPLYIMSVVAPSDCTILRHPATTHPQSSLDEFEREVSFPWNTAPELPIAF